jgi:hypothetical protein
VFNSLYTNAQKIRTGGLLPAFSYTKKHNDLWRSNFKWESRQLFYNELDDQKTERSFEYVLSDFSYIISRKIGLQNTLSAGYLFRLEENRNAHRFIQQFTIVKNYERLRTAHRFVADQTLREENWTYRGRYRITVEWPLQGHTLDNKEWYLKVNNEYLNAFSNQQYELEMRFVPLLGYVFSNNQKIEMGLDYRQAFFSQINRKNLWLAFTYYV